MIAAGVVTAVVLAGAFAAGAALLPAGLRPLRLDADTARTLGPAVTGAFDRVRTIHLGAYAGALMGTTLAVRRTIRR